MNIISERVVSLNSMTSRLNIGYPSIPTVYSIIYVSSRFNRIQRASNQFTLYSYITQTTMAGFDSALAPFTLKGFYLCTWGTAVGTNVWQTLVCPYPHISSGVVINLDLRLTSSPELGHSSLFPDRHSVLSKPDLLRSTSQPQQSSLQPSY